MSQETDVGTQALAFAQAIGLVDGDGNLDASWFENPMDALADVLSDTDQRDAVVDLLDLLLPESPGAPDGWREIVEDSGFRVYLTTDTTGGSLTLGVAGTVSAPGGVRIDLTVPLVDAPGGGAAPQPVVGTATGRIRVDVQVPVGLSSPPIGLSAIEGAVELQFEPSVQVVPVLELKGLQVGSAPASDRRFDTEDLGDDVVDLVLGLLEDALSQVGVPSELADHLLPLLGLGTGVTAIPELPLLRLPNDPAAFRGWIRQLVEGAGLSEWLGHLAGLVGAPTAVSGSGALADPWRVALFRETDFSLELTVGVADGRVWPGLELRAGQNQHTNASGLHVYAHAVVVGLPYVGLDDPVLSPDVQVLVRSPSPLVPFDGTFGCGRLQGGMTWDGSAIVPRLELLNVQIDGTTHDRVDLTNTEEIAGLAQSAVEAALRAVVGTGPGLHLLALAGVIRPAGADPTWPHALDVARFLVDPVGAIGGYHRAVLAHPTDTWSVLHAEVSALLGLGAVTGTGSETDPWRFALASAGSVEVRVDAWRVSAGGVESVRLGLAVGAVAAPFSVAARAELVAFSVPASGAPTLEVGARLVGQLAIDPLPRPPDMGSFTIGAASIQGRVEWEPGRAVDWDVQVDDVQVGLEGATLPTIDLRFPGSALDFTNPGATASGLGITVAQLDAVVRGLLWRAARSWGGRDGQMLATLAGLGRGAWGLPADLPLLGGDTGTLLTDPLGSLRPWLSDLVGTPGADGRVPVEHLIHLVHAWLDDLLPTTYEPFLEERVRGVAGQGTESDPWRLDVDRHGNLQVCLWAGPEGPALPALGAASGGDADAVADLARILRSGVATVGAALEADDDHRLAAGLEALDAFFAESDGIVPVASQQPQGWTAPTPLAVAHAGLPAHADAITAVRQHVAGLSGSPVTLLLSAPFADHTTWAPLLASAGLPGTTDPAAHFDLRVADIPPSGVDLNAVTAVADWYTADLGDTGQAASELAQIKRILDRLQVLAPGRQVVLVAHSTTGNAARRAARAHPGRVAGIVTLGTPHMGARPVWASQEPAGLALHLARTVATALPAGALRDAVEAALSVVDGKSGAPWSPAFLDPADTDTGVGAVPALAVAGRAGSGLLAAFETGLRGLAPGAPRAAATHLGLCLRATLGDPVAGHDLGVRTLVEVDLGRLGLSDGSLDAGSASFRVRVELDGGGGWLVGGPGLEEDGTPWPVRCRRAALVATLEGGDVHFQVEAVGTSADLPAVIGFSDPQAFDVLDAVFARLSAEPLATPLLADLRTLGLAVTGPDGGTGLSADAVNAFRATGMAWLAPRLRSALTTGLNTLSSAAPTDVGGDLPVQLQASLSPARLALATTGDGISMGDLAHLTLSLGVGLPGGGVTYDASLGFRGFGLRAQDGALTLTAGAWMDPLPLLPADATAFQARAEALLPRLVFSAATTALVEATLPDGLRLGPLDRLLMGGGGSGTNGGNGTSGGNGSSGGSATPPPPPDAITPLLQVLNRAIGNPPGDGLALPGDLVVEATAAGDATRLSVRTTAPLGGIVGLELGVDVAPGLAVTPSGAVTVEIPDDAGGSTPLVGVTLSHGAPGTGLEIRPAGAGTITLLPSFSGFGSLLAGGVALLPRALDALDDALATSPVKTAVLNVATAMDIYDAVGGFAPHTTRFQALLTGDWDRNGPQQAALVAAARALLGLIPSLPGSLGGTGTQITWTLSVSGGSTGSVTLGLDWADDLPTISGGVTDLVPAGAPVRLGATLAVAPTGSTPFSLSLSAALDDPLDLPLRPALSLAADTTTVTFRLLPLATASGEGPIRVRLLPSPDLATDPDLAERIVVDVVFPLLLSLLDRAVGTDDLWTGGPSVRDVLVASGLVDSGGKPVLPPPEPLDALAGAASSLSATIPVDDLSLVFGNVGGGLGFGVNGVLEIPVDDLVLKLRFESPNGWMSTTPAAAVRLVLLQNVSGWTFRPRFDAEGLGLGLAGQNGDLVRSDILRLGSVDAYAFFGLAFHPWSASFDGAGVRLGGVGLPLNQLSGGGGNGVVAGLLNGGEASDGEPGGAQPSLGIDAWYLEDAFHVEFDGEVGPLWITVQAGFGPLYIEQVGVGLMTEDGTTVGVDLLVDGGVSFAGLSVMVDDLTLGVPFRHIGDPSRWTVDLAGLAIAYSGSGVTIAGGLVKSETAQGVEYVGMLRVEVQSFGLVAIGAWGSLTDEEGDFTSLFIFAALFLTISFPPYLEIRGLGLGFGYNRRLLVPDDVTQVPSFPLVSALDSAGTFLDNPMAALDQMRQRIPARRGSYWFAVGFHGTTFVVVHVTAVLYVALDSGVEVGIIGVARMMLPTADTALVSIELALKARFSSSEGLLSIQAQLTDNSWLLSRDCQLTGGFAFFMWFERGQFLLTIGGYHPSFQREPEYPEVPRVGLRWDLGPIHIKGETYFALTNSAVMAGVRFEASYTLGSWLKVWFKAWADFLLQWDPFYYDISIGIELGARVSFTINLLFGKIRITLTLALGASLRVMGPPIRGVVTAKLGPFKVTVAFGSSDQDTEYLGWAAFRDKYVLNDEAGAPGTGLGPGAGLLQPEQKGSDPPTGLVGDPWRFNPEFSFRSETKMPASSAQGPVSNAQENVTGVHDLDAAPMNAEALTADHVVTIERKVGSQWRDVRDWQAAELDWNPALQTDVDARLERYPEAVWKLGKAAAASRNIKAIGGLSLTFRAVAKGIPTQPIPIATLVDPLPRAPNPFTVFRAGQSRLRDLAREAVTLVDAATITDRFQLAAVFLERGGLFDGERQALGLTDGGLDGVGLDALRRRTTPPEVAALSSGLTMEALELGASPEYRVSESVRSLALESPRLRAVAALPVVVARSTAPALRTRVSNADGVRRVAAPTLEAGRGADTLGARLVRVPPAGATPGTGRARTVAVRRGSATGAPVSRKATREMAALEEAVASNGVALSAGQIQHWEVPAHDRTWTLDVQGSGAIRVLCLGRGSKVLSDHEHTVGDQASVPLPAGTSQVVTVALGRTPGTVKPGPGAVSRAFAPGGSAAVGWQADSTVFVATEALLLARGSRIRLGGPSPTAPGRPELAGRAVAGRATLQTWLPARAGTVMVMVERRGSGTLEAPEVGILGGDLGAPLQEQAGRRHVWLYPVTPGEGREMAVTLALGQAWTPAGVVLVPGTPEQVGARLNGRDLPRMVSDGPVSDRGALRMTLNSTPVEPR